MATRNDGSAFNLPAAPPELCFDKNEFAKPTFSVDDFLHVHRNSGASMESMRDDLGVYLKVLRSAMIELINEDYADFVNLATNLRGLDQQIGAIRTPLEQLRADIVAVQSTLTDTMAELSGCLDDKRAVRRDAQATRARIDVAAALANIERLLASDADASPLADRLSVLERVAMDCVRIGHELQFFDDSDDAELVQAVRRTHGQLLDALDDHFVAALQPRDQPADDDEQRLERVLRIYGTLDKCAAAEVAFRRRVVAVHLHPIIGEQALQNQPQGVTGIYRRVLQFVDQRMGALLALTAGPPPVRVHGFDFLLRACWPEIEQRLETHLSSIFAPGNPDQFQAKYEATMEFLRDFERRLGAPDAVAAFRQHDQYRSFQTRWNLPVYFQIRYQEIGSAVEAACCRPIGTAGSLRAASEASPMRFAVPAVALDSVRRCWSQGVYLAPVFVRLWKFTLQILQRTAGWLDEFVALKEWPTQPTNVMPTMADALVHVHGDVLALIGQLPPLLDAILAHLDGDRRATYEPKLRVCLTASERTLRDRLGAIERRLSGEIVANSAPHIRQVNDIPRLFRKTNREVPAKAAGYVEQMLLPLAAFDGGHRERLGADVMRTMCLTVFGQLTGQYYVAVKDVLTSVQKTEESLRRLKNLREKSAAGQPSVSAPTSATAMSDDDKIRLQLQLDVQHWAQSVDRWGVERSTVDKLNELLAVVEESAKQRSQQTAM